jgi:hypothetical protein
MVLSMAVVSHRRLSFSTLAHNPSLRWLDRKRSGPQRRCGESRIGSAKLPYKLCLLLVLLLLVALDLFWMLVGGVTVQDTA